MKRDLPKHELSPPIKAEDVIEDFLKRHAAFEHVS
jgi:hypothetical protein